MCANRDKPTEQRSLPYRGCTKIAPRAGTARTAPVWILRAAGHAHGHAHPLIRLDLGDMPWAGVPCWSGGAERWARETVPAAYKQRYDTHVRPVMPGNPISLPTLIKVAAARARYADHRTGRDCRPTNATLAACAGVSIRTVQRASTALRLLGVATEVLRGRQRSRNERMASWRVADKGRGWASVWALHDNRNRCLSPHPAGSLFPEKPSVKNKLTTQHRRHAGGSRTATRRDSPEPGARLARQWVLDPTSPPWARRYRTPQAWARLLAGPETHNWTPRDVNQLISDYIGVGNWVPDSPHKPAGLLGHILKWHDNLQERPAALDEAREAEQLAAERARIAANAAEREQHRRAREMGRAALDGPGHAAARKALEEALQRKRQRREPNPGPERQ
ncbi:helix-turn-helix domain-containing protein [Mycobacterium lehmannii]|uniref:helix-turn-helix domain-containing protein n=1 Tax=Mycobacterium lehmannii TaxID=2048550 RepID=UPI001E60C746|nr:helix-turn-helix domain-containing protein [Mycobacterium lehmannii]